jgi:hypothetical protein
MSIAQNGPRESRRKSAPGPLFLGKTHRPSWAIPILDKVIHGNESRKMKDKALFVLSQSSSEKAQQSLLSIAKAGDDPDLQKRAIRYLGMNGNSRNRAILKEIYTSSANPEVKKAVFQGWLMCGVKDDVLAVAQQEKSPELHKEAIRYLGMMGGRNELRQLIKQETDRDVKDALLQALGISGDVQGWPSSRRTIKTRGRLQEHGRAMLRMQCRS